MANIDINSFDDFKAFLAQIPEMKLREKLIQKGNGITISFEELNKEIDILYRMNKSMNSIDSTTIPDEVFKSIRSESNQLIDSISGLINFNFNSAQTNDNRIGTISNIRNCFSTFYQKVNPLILQIVFENMATDAFIEIHKEAEKRLLIVESITEQIRDAAKEAGVSIHSADFETEANRKERFGWSWLSFTGLFATLTVIAPIFLPQYLQIYITNDIQLISSKIVIIAILLSATLWCGRIYKANKHQEALARHKSIALSTFKTFVTATEDPQVKNAVLLEATRAIFTTPTTGYVATSDHSSNEMTILEMVKNIPKQ